METGGYKMSEDCNTATNCPTCKPKVIRQIQCLGCINTQGIQVRLGANPVTKAEEIGMTCNNCGGKRFKVV